MYTPNVDKTIDEIEMRKTHKTKPQIISSKLPPAFEIPKYREKMYIKYLIVGLLLII
jgi:hypothetical protein